jgi:hypothetical protein
MERLPDPEKQSIAQRVETLDVICAYLNNLCCEFHSADEADFYTRIVNSATISVIRLHLRMKDRMDAERLAEARRG